MEGRSTETYPATRATGLERLSSLRGRTRLGKRTRFNVDSAHFDQLISKYPVLGGEKGQLRPGVHFRRFDDDLASSVCGSSYVIPFVSETHCLMTRRSNGKWVLPGGTVEPGESWEEAGRRELLEETGCVPENLHPIGMYHCVTRNDRPTLSRVPHPAHVRVVSWADVVRNTEEGSDPDPRSRIVEVRTVHFSEASELFGPESKDFGELYQFAHDLKRVQESSDLNE